MYHHLVYVALLVAALACLSNAQAIDYTPTTTFSFTSRPKDSFPGDTDQIAKCEFGSNVANISLADGATTRIPFTIDSKFLSGDYEESLSLYLFEVGYLNWTIHNFTYSMTFEFFAGESLIISNTLKCAQSCEQKLVALQLCRPQATTYTLALRFQTNNPVPLEREGLGVTIGLYGALTATPVWLGDTFGESCPSWVMVYWWAIALPSAVVVFLAILGGVYLYKRNRDNNPYQNVHMHKTKKGKYVPAAQPNTLV